MAEEEKQPQLRRPKAGEGPIKYGDVFEMSGKMAGEPISPRDAAAMESAENRAFGKTIKGGPASLMRSAAAINVEAGLVGPDEASPAFADHGLVEGEPWNESQPAHEHSESALSGPDALGLEGAGGGIAIGEALLAAAAAIGDKPVDQADAAANIQAAEMRATGVSSGLGSGLGAEAQAAAMVNARMVYDEDKTTLSEIIGEAANVLTDDKPVTRSDAELVRAAELRGDPEGVVGTDALHHHAIKHSTTPGGVAEAAAAAARINQPDTDQQ